MSRDGAGSWDDTSMTDGERYYRQMPGWDGRFNQDVLNGDLDDDEDFDEDDGFADDDEYDDDDEDEDEDWDDSDLEDDDYGDDE